MDSREDAFKKYVGVNFERIHSLLFELNNEVSELKKQFHSILFELKNEVSDLKKQIRD